MAKINGIILSVLMAISFLMTGCPPPDPIFSFVVIADPHLYGNQDFEDRLAGCVDWINDNAAEKKIELALVVGDIAWGSGQILIARSILDNLSVPYFPLIGDNEIPAYEDDFESVFATHFSQVALEVESWDKPTLPIWNPEISDWSYFQNYSFDYRGIHFLAADWATRQDVTGLPAEQADLHDFEDGTWQWFTGDITSCEKPLEENILMFTHHPMHVAPILEIEVAAFSSEEDDGIQEFLSGFSDNVALNIAGHYHIPWQENRPSGYQIRVVEATHIGQNRLMLVGVTSDGLKYEYWSQYYVAPY